MATKSSGTQRLDAVGLRDSTSVHYRLASERPVVYGKIKFLIWKLDEYATAPHRDARRPEHCYKKKAANSSEVEKFGSDRELRAATLVESQLMKFRILKDFWDAGFMIGICDHKLIA